MKRTLAWVGILVVLVLLIASLIGCERERLSDDELDRVAEKITNTMMQHPLFQTAPQENLAATIVSDDDLDRMAESIVEALMSNPQYLDFLNDDDDLDRMVDSFVEALMSNPQYLDFLNDDDDLDRMVNSLVEALMSNPQYLDFLNDDDEWVEKFANAIMEHPLYQTTPEEDCAATIITAVVISGEHDLPLPSETDRLCEWYRDVIERLKNSPN